MPILIGVTLIVLAGLGVLYFQQQREQTSLNDQAAQLQILVSNPMQINEDLQAEYDETLEILTAEAHTEEVIQAVLDLAELYGFDVIIGSQEVRIATMETREEKVRDSTYYFSVFQIQVTGDYYQVTDFIDELDFAPPLDTLVIEDLHITLGEGGVTTANLDFGVYTLKQ